MEKPGHACHQPLSAIVVLRKSLLYQQEDQRQVPNTDGKGNREFSGEQNRSRSGEDGRQKEGAKE